MKERRRPALANPIAYLLVLLVMLSGAVRAQIADNTIDTGEQNDLAGESPEREEQLDALIEQHLLDT